VLTITVRGEILALFHAGGVAIRRNRRTITPHRALSAWKMPRITLTQIMVNTPSGGD